MNAPEKLTPIAEYSETAAALADLRQKYEKVVFQVATKDGMQVAVKARAELRGYRVALEKKRVEIKAPALERTRLIDAEAKRITAELSALEDPIDSLIKQEEGRKERERAEREAALQDGRTMLTTFVSNFGQIPEFATVAKQIAAFLKAKS